MTCASSIAVVTLNPAQCLVERRAQRRTMDFALEPDLHPVYPSPSLVTSLLASQAGLAPAQRTSLVDHSLTRACLFGDINLLSYLFADPQARVLLNLGLQDEDG